MAPMKDCSELVVLLELPIGGKVYRIPEVGMASAEKFRQEGMTVATQRTGEWVKAATPEAIADAFGAGELVDYLASDERGLTSVETPREGQRSEAWVKAATADQIMAAREGHELDDLMGIVRNEAGNTAEDMRQP